MKVFLRDFIKRKVIIIQNGESVITIDRESSKLCTITPNIG